MLDKHWKSSLVQHNAQTQACWVSDQMGSRVPAAMHDRVPTHATSTMRNHSRLLWCNERQCSQSLQMPNNKAPFTIASPLIQFQPYTSHWSNSCCRCQPKTSTNPHHHGTATQPTASNSHFRAQTALWHFCAPLPLPAPSPLHPLNLAGALNDKWHAQTTQCAVCCMNLAHPLPQQITTRMALSIEHEHGFIN